MDKLALFGHYERKADRVKNRVAIPSTFVRAMRAYQELEEGVPLSLIISFSEDPWHFKCYTRRSFDEDIAANLSMDPLDPKRIRFFSGDYLEKRLDVQRRISLNTEIPTPTLICASGGNYVLITTPSNYQAILEGSDKIFKA